MSSEKKPSIYDDRGFIGSSEELDEYGVWVKSEPQEISGLGNASGLVETGFTEPIETADLPDLDLPAMDELVEAAEISAKASHSSGEKEFGFSLDDEEKNEDFLFDDVGEENVTDLPVIEDFDAITTDDIDDIDIEETTETGEIANEYANLDFDDLDTSELKSEEEKSSKDELEELGFTEVDDDVFSVQVPDDTFFDGEEPADELSEEDEFDELVLDDTVPELPMYENLSDPAFEDDFAGTSELVESLDLADDTDAGEEKKPEPKETDLSTQLLMKIAEELSSIRTELTTLKKEMTLFKTEAPEESAAQGFFNRQEDDDEKIALTGDELDDILNKEETENRQEAGPEIEISEPDAGTVEEESKDEDQTQGFFHDDEDETIALTGDELNNILNTADFTEETGVAENSADEDAASFEVEETWPAEIPGAEESENTDIDIALEGSSLGEAEMEIDLDGPPPEEDSAVGLEFVEDELLDEPLTEEAVLLDELEIDEVSLEEASLLEIPNDDTALPEGENVDIDYLQEEGVQPMTAAPEPEETDFLEEDPMALSGFDEQIDLSGAVIDEPDLSSEVQDNPVTEPSFDDISIDLLMDEDGGGGEEAEEEGFRLDIEEEIEIPLDEEEYIPMSPEGDEESPYAEETGTEDEDDLALLPEGFVVEADDTQSGSYNEKQDVTDADDSENIPASESGDASSSSKDNPEEILYDENESETAELEDSGVIPSPLKKELKTVLLYMDQLLESLPDNKIEEFAKSEYFDTYKKLFKELGLV